MTTITPTSNNAGYTANETNKKALILKEDEISIMCLSSDAIEAKKATLLDERTGNIADIIYEEGENTSNNGTTACAIGGLGAIAGIAAGIFIGSNPVGWAVGGISLLLGGGLTIWGGSTIHKGEVKQNEADNYHTPAKEEMEKRPNDNPIVDCVNGIFDPSTPNVPSSEDLSYASSELKDRSEGYYTDIYIHNNTTIKGDGTIVNQNSQVGQIDFVYTDLNEYDTVTKEFGSPLGYKTEKYNYASEYTQVLNTFDAESSTNKINDTIGNETIIVNGLTKQESKKLKDIAIAFEKEGFDDEKNIFDINGDGYLNTADLITLNFTASGKTDILNKLTTAWQNHNGDLEKAIIDTYIGSIEEIEGIKASEKYNNATPSEKRTMANEYLNILTDGLYSDMKDFDINKDDHADDIDLSYLKSINAKNEEISDINGDGYIDSADLKILNSYLKANMDRLKTVEQEAEYIKNATFKDGQINEKYKNELLGL